MSKVIAVINQKGGVAKTATVFNIAACLARAGKKVLAVDLDPQGSLTVSYGIEPEQVKLSMYNVLCKAEPIKKILLNVRDNLDLAPAIIDLSTAELELTGYMARETILKKALQPVGSEYDFILIDCPPSLTLLPINALCAANYVLIPVATDYMAYRGLHLLLDTLDSVRETINPKLELLGLIATFYDRRTRHAKEVLDNLEKEKLLGVIDRSVSVADSVMAQEPIIDYDAAGKISQEFMKITDKIIAGTGE